MAIPGNHDDRTLLRAAFSDRPYAESAGALNLAVAVGDLDVFLIDSSVPGSAHGEVATSTLTWLGSTLAAAKMRPAFVFLHHPPFSTGIGHMDMLNLRNADDLASILRRHARVRLVAAGHIHRAVLTTFAGISATICPAPNYAVALDLDGRLPRSFKLEPPGFHLHAWFRLGEYGDVVTHFVPLGDFEGPYPF